MRQLGDRLFSCVFLLLLSSCAALAPTSATHVQYPVVAAFGNRDDVLQGTIDNNLMTGTAYVEVVSDNDSLHCRGEAHLTDRGVGDSCAGGKGDCNLTCDNGESLLCKYRLQSCTSGFGAGLDQGKNWFAFRFGKDINHERTELLAERLQHAAAMLPPASPVKQEPPQGSTRKSDEQSFGSGFFVSSDGFIATSNHVVSSSQNVNVITRSGDVLPASIIAADPVNDIALLKVEARVKPVAVTSSEGIAVGEDVLALGYPLPTIEGAAQKATFGRINALSGVGDDVRFLQIDVPIQPGNSGGPLFSSNGGVIGIVTAILNQESTLKAAGVVPQNVNYAIKSDYLLPLLAQQEIRIHHVSSKAPSNRPELVKQLRDSVVLIIAR
jgi:S1-C subfamily serine protease